MFPTGAALRPEATSMAAAASVTVVFPLVAVTAP